MVLEGEKVADDEPFALEILVVLALYVDIWRLGARGSDPVKNNAIYHLGS